MHEHPMSSSPKCTMSSPQSHTGHTWWGLASKSSSIVRMGGGHELLCAGWQLALKLKCCPKMAGSQRTPQCRQYVEMLEETYDQEDGREDM